MNSVQFDCPSSFTPFTRLNDSINRDCVVDGKGILKSQVIRLYKSCRWIWCLPVILSLSQYPHPSLCQLLLKMVALTSLSFIIKHYSHTLSSIHSPFISKLLNIDTSSPSSTVSSWRMLHCTLLPNGYAYVWLTTPSFALLLEQLNLPTSTPLSHSFAHIHQSVSSLFEAG